MDSKKEIKKVKKVNGFKVNHPHSFGNMAFAFFMLLIVALPVGILFLPLVQLPNASDPTVATVTGLDLIKHDINIIMFNINPDATIEPVLPVEEFLATTQNAFDNAFSSTPDTATMLMNIINYVLLGQGIIIAIFALNAVLALIVFIVLIIKGYLRHSGFVKFLWSMNNTFASLFDTSFLAFFIIFLIAKASDQFFIWFSMIPLGVTILTSIILNAIRKSIYVDVIFEKDLEYKDDSTSKETVQQTNVHTITVTNYEPANTLPENIDHIGGHEFSENQNLIYANIPENIDKLGPGAFANCLKLQVVSLPVSIKEIGFNCFFNCVSLERLNYAGTKEQWRHVIRGSNWLAKAKTSEVICVDGSVVVNPFH